ncbi:MAG: hypothetical protein M3Q27_04610 [Actinomycetota bacterium]|nr:hypothetical protein [Actinomycetota bacterium]
MNDVRDGAWELDEDGGGPASAPPETGGLPLEGDGAAPEIEFSADPGDRDPGNDVNEDAALPEPPD